ncbi:MAG TPA: hypothetical protein ENJ00_06740 [Phycisphaerales bacterium]|nr:hypothetical protein [Phycisphaerales bacterium]
MIIKDEQLDTMLASIASQDWNGPSFNQRVEQEILERNHVMELRKRTMGMVGVVVGASLLSASVAAAVTHRIVSHRVPISAKIVLPDGRTAFVTGEAEIVLDDALDPTAPGNNELLTDPKQPE